MQVAEQSEVKGRVKVMREVLADLASRWLLQCVGLLLYPALSLTLGLGEWVCGTFSISLCVDRAQLRFSGALPFLCWGLKSQQ